MSLAQMKWAPVSIHKVILTWLRSVRGTNVARTLSAFPMPLWSLGLSRLLDNPTWMIQKKPGESAEWQARHHDGSRWVVVHRVPGE